MPVTIKRSQLMYKNESTGEYVSVDAVADKTSQQQINGINIAASNAIASINTAMQDIDTQPLTTLPKKAYKKDLVANEETLASAATHAYAIGDYFFVADNNNDISLYKATAAIAVGATISPGTGIDNNCIPAALADDVTSLSNDIDTVKADLDDNVDNVNGLKSTIKRLGEFAADVTNDILPLFGTYEVCEKAGVKFTVSGKTITAVGTTTGIAAYNFYLNESVLPDTVTPGETYKFYYSAIKNANPSYFMIGRVGFKVNDVWEWTNLTVNQASNITVPVSATGMVVRVWETTTGHYINETFTFEISALNNLTDDKADKVNSATSGNFAGLDSNGNITDSGKSPSDINTNKKDIHNLGVFATGVTNDVLPLFGTYESVEKNGVVYTVNGKTVAAVGTTTGISSYNFCLEEHILPFPFTEGAKFYFLYSAKKNSESTYLPLARVGFKVNDVWEWTNLTVDIPELITIPTGASGVIIRVWENTTGRAINCTFTFAIYAAKNMANEIVKLKTKRTISDSYSPSVSTSQGVNTGTKIRVMTYNVAEYDNDTPTKIPNEKLFNLKKMLYKANSDILCVQEDVEYIDGNSKGATGYVYLPVYYGNYGVDKQTIRSKTSASDAGASLLLNTGRRFRYVVYTFGDIKLLVISAHTSLTEEDRLSDYTQIYSWVTDPTYPLWPNVGENAIFCPEHTHVIIGLDANTKTVTDKTNLTTVFTGNNDFVLGNGGAIGWFITNPRTGDPNDNIIISDNIIINSIETYDDWYEDLYSDHVPVIADLTLL